MTEQILEIFFFGFAHHSHSVPVRPDLSSSSSASFFISSVQPPGKSWRAINNFPKKKPRKIISGFSNSAKGVKKYKLVRQKIMHTIVQNIPRFAIEKK